MNDTTRDNLTDRSIWTRGLYTVFFAIAYAIAEALVSLIAVVQFILALVSGQANASLLKLGASLSVYLYQIVQFVTFNDERLPFPFNEWPDEQPGTGSPWARASADAEPAPSAATTAPPAVSTDSSKDDSVGDSPEQKS